MEGNVLKELSIQPKVEQIIECKSIIKLKKIYNIVFTINKISNILFILSLIPTIVLTKKYKDKKALIIWIIALIISLSVYISKSIFGGLPPEYRTQEGYFKSRIIIDIIGILIKFIPVIYSTIKLIINIKKDKANSITKEK